MRSDVSSIFKSNDEYRECIKEVLKGLDTSFYYKCAIEISEKAIDDTEYVTYDALFDNAGAREIVKDVFMRLIREKPQIEEHHMTLLRAYIKVHDRLEPLDDEMVDSIMQSLENHPSEVFFKGFYDLEEKHTGRSFTSIFKLTLLRTDIFPKSEKSDIFFETCNNIPSEIKIIWKIYRRLDKTIFKIKGDPNKSLNEILEREINNLDKVSQIEDEFDKLVENGKITLEKANSLLESVKENPVELSKYEEVVNKIKQKIEELSKS